MNKRGLSTIVMSLLLILLGLVAVGIFWVVVRNVVQGGAEEIDLGKLTVDLEIQSVKSDGGSIDVMVKRNPGEGEISKMKFIFNDEETSKSIEREISLDELDKKKFTFSQEELEELNYFNITKVSIAPIFKSGKEESVGNVADVYDSKTNGEIFSNLVANGDFSIDNPDTYWTKGNGWGVSGREARFSSASTGTLQQTVGAVAEHKYKLTFTITLSGGTSGSVTPGIGGVTGSIKSGVGTYTEEITATGTGDLTFFHPGMGSVSIDNVIIYG